MGSDNRDEKKDISEDFQMKEARQINYSCQQNGRPTLK